MGNPKATDSGRHSKAVRPVTPRRPPFRLYIYSNGAQQTGSTRIAANNLVRAPRFVWIIKAIATAELGGSKTLLRGVPRSTAAAGRGDAGRHRRSQIPAVAFTSTTARSTIGYDRGSDRFTTDIVLNGGSTRNLGGSNTLNRLSSIKKHRRHRHPTVATAPGRADADRGLNAITAVNDNAWTVPRHLRHVADLRGGQHQLLVTRPCSGRTCVIRPRSASRAAARFETGCGLSWLLTTSSRSLRITTAVGTRSHPSTRAERWTGNHRTGLPG